MLKRMALVAGMLVVSASCQKFAEGRQMFSELLHLRDQIAAEFHEKVVDVNVTTEGAMTVKFVDSPLNSATPEAKQKRADEVAAFVMSHYKHRLMSVSTSFAAEAGPNRLEERFVGVTAPKR